MSAFRFTYLQAGRALAASGVLLLHASHFTQAVATKMPDLLYQILQFGYLGVDYFFVLSGFIISYSYSTSAGARTTEEFLWRRAVRIYIPY